MEAGRAGELQQRDVPPGDYGLRALLAVRARFFLSYRLLIRLLQAVSVGSGVRSARWQLLLVLFGSLDIVTWVLLRSQERFGFRTRLILDALDIAIWSMAPYTPRDGYALAVFVGTPLALEAGIRTPRAAFAVPMITLGTTSVVRFVAGRPFMPLPFLWLVLATMCGVVLSGYDRRLRLRAKKDWANRRVADDRRAYLAGQNAVAMGASSVVDGIEGVVPLIGRPTPGSALWQLSDGWKGVLSSSTREEGVALEAAYLLDTLKVWERHQNRHPDLSGRVSLTLAEGIGTLILTGTQIQQVHECFASLNLRGHVRVQLADELQALRPPGSPVRLRVDGQAVAVPADRRRPVQTYEPGPVCFLVMGLLALSDVIQMRIPPAATVGCLSLYFGAAAWSHHWARERARAARPETLALAVAVAVITTVVFSLTARQVLKPSGEAMYPLAPQLDLLAVLAGGYRSTLGRRDRVLATAGASAVLVLAWLLYSGAGQFSAFSINLLWAGCALVCAWQLSPELDRAVARYVADFTVETPVADALAFRSGQADVLDLARRARDDAYRQLASIETALSPILLQAARKRLEEVDQRLENVLVDAASS